jgi:uncharacterized protein YndB with AHSA1/START domain
MATRPATRSLTLNRIVEASRERAFQAWTQPEELKRWLAPGDLTVELVQVDLRPGGRYRVHMREPGGKVHRLVGAYQVVEVPGRLVFTWRWESEEKPVETRVTVDFRALGADRTEIVVLHEFFPTEAMCAQHVSGWNACLLKLPPLFH